MTRFKQMIRDDRQRELILDEIDLKNRTAARQEEIKHLINDAIFWTARAKSWKKSWEESLLDINNLRMQVMYSELTERDFRRARHAISVSRWMIGLNQNDPVFNIPG